MDIWTICKDRWTFGIYEERHMGNIEGQVDIWKYGRIGGHMGNMEEQVDIWKI